MLKRLQQNVEHFTKISFYIVAHADDWQLFMQPGVYKDLISFNCKVVIIVVTGGDSGRSEIFWKAREEGAKCSVRHCLVPFGNLNEVNDTGIFNSHAIHYSAINNATLYFMRLPDGNIDGNGFGKYNFQSLAKFKGNHIFSLQANDGSTVYQGWDDLVTTIEGILIHESQAIQAIQVNCPNPDVVKNPDDHIDHILVGEVVQNIPLVKRATQFLFTGYSICSNNGVLHASDMFYKIGMFAVYEKAVYDICGYSTLAEDPHIYKDWCLAKSNFEMLPASLLCGQKI